MCFLNEADWYASINQESIGTANKQTKCDECYAVIKEGDWIYELHQQQYEECRACDNGECGCPVDADGDPVCITKGCQCEDPDHGDTFDYERCESCHKFLQAVEESEVEAGCAKREARPMLTSMAEELCEADDKHRYFQKAAKKFPELAKSGYLAKLAKLARQVFH